MNQLISSRYQFKYDLKQLRSFMAVAERLSFRQAAEALFISQPALSRHIANLEAVLGCKLFVRDKNKVTLTLSGERLYNSLPTILEQLYQVTTSLSEKACGDKTISIGYTYTAMASFFPSLIREVREALPECEFDFSEAMDNKLVDDVFYHRIDGAFIMSRPDNSQLKRVDIRSEPLGVVIPVNHPLAGNDAIPLSALSEETLILFPRQNNPALYEQIISRCEQAGFVPHAIREAQSGHAAIGLVAADAGIALLTQSMAPACLKGTCFKPLSPPVPEVSYSFITRQDCHGHWVTIFEQYIHQHLTPAQYCGRDSETRKRHGRPTDSVLSAEV